MQDFRYLVKRGGNTWLATKPVPRHLRSILGKSHLRKSLKTTDPVIARQRRWSALARFQTLIDQAQKQHGAGSVLSEALAWREHLARIKAGDLSRIWDSRFPEGGEPLRRAALAGAVEFIAEDTGAVAAQHGPAIATAYRDVALGRGTPLMLHVPHWLKEGGNTERTQQQHTSAVQHFADWCQQAGIPMVIESISKETAGRYVRECFIDAGVHQATANKRIGSLSSYWTWLLKRTNASVNPWRGQRLAKGRNVVKTKRPFSNDEMRVLLAGPAGVEMHDAIRLASLSGLRLDELYQLRISQCNYGIFDVKGTKTAAAVRIVPVHSDLAAIVAQRCAGKAPGDFLMAEAGPAKKDRGKSMSNRFRDYRLRLHVEDRDEGKRHSKIDFHSFRRWFITQARIKNDVGIVAVLAGHKTGTVTDDIYNSGPELEARRRCVESVTLPV